MRTIIVGGGGAGASCAARLRRLNEKDEIIIIEKSTHISIANCGLPYYCSGVINEREKLIISNPEKFKGFFDVDIKLNSELTSIDKENKTITINNNEKINYDNLVLTLGSSPIKPAIPGIENKNIFTVKNLEDTDKIIDYIKENNPKTAAVIGGGFIGIEMAENLVEMEIETTLIELADQILAPVDKEIAAFAQNQMRDNGTNIILSDGVKEFKEKQVMLNSGKLVNADLVIFAIGVRPEVGAAKEARLKLGETGGLLVNEYMQTSDENIYAAGDSVEVVDFITGDKTLIPLAGPANRQGRIIADNINGTNSKYNHTQGTAAVKVFDLTIASVGNNEKQLINKNINYKKTFVWGFSHASYYPNSFPLLIKLLFNDEGKIFGAQAVGYEMVEKRIDVISSIIRLNGTIQDLIDSELCYAPPYSSAKDPVNIIGMNAENIIKGIVKPAFFEDIKDSYLIDIRPENIFKIKTIDGAVNIPITELRDRLNEVPKDRKVILFCDKGFNSYISSRILVQNGFDNVYSLAGGIILYKELLRDKEGKPLMNKKDKLESIAPTPSITIDACGLQCPGPIMKLSEKVKEASEGEIIEISTTDSGFKADVESWCNTTGNQLLDLRKEGQIIKAYVQKGNKKPIENIKSDKQTIVVFSNDLDKALASFIIANGAAASGKEVTLFFTFWGLNILRKAEHIKVKKNFLDKMFGLMMPKGAEKLLLSKMNMGGIGTKLMKYVMKEKNILTLTELMNQARENGIKFIACNMSMDVMGIKKEELVNGVEIAGVAKYIEESSKSNSNLFI